MAILIKGGTILSGGERRENPGLLLKDGKIAGPAQAEPARILDAGGGYILPGLVDIHTHGALGRDFTEGTQTAFDIITRFAVRHGVTSQVATLFTMPMAQILRCIQFARDYRRHPQGAQILGLHLEGPFISPERCGAQASDAVLPIAPENYAPLLAQADAIRMITLSPHCAQAEQMVRAFCQRGVKVTGGHDDGYEPMIAKCFDAGMHHTVHLFCAMSSARFRQGEKVAGLTEMALLDDRVSVELIADRAHTTPALIALACKCKPADKVCLVSDMLSVGGLPPQEEPYSIRIPGVEKALEVEIGPRSAKLAGSNHNAGGITALDRMLRNMVEDGVPLEAAARMATENPALAIGARQKGRIEPGMDADICILDQELQVRYTIIAGEVVYHKEV